jgi:hypothetical protein
MPKEASMADRVNERAMVAEDQRTLERTRRAIDKKKNKDAGDRQIAAQLEAVSGTADLDDPQRYHGS